MANVTLGKVGESLNDILKDVSKKEIQRFDKAYRAEVVDTLNSVINMTPVDKGALRNSWMLSQTYSRNAKSSGKSNKGASYLKRKTAGGMLGKIFYFYNNLPYAEIVEYGGYPNPVKKGSKRPKQKGYIKYSSGGFSKQAPTGMLRVNLLGFYSRLRKRWQLTKR